MGKVWGRNVGESWWKLVKLALVYISGPEIYTPAGLGKGMLNKLGKVRLA